MKRNVWVFGLISGSIVAAMLVLSSVYMLHNPEFEGGMAIGFTSMLLAFAFIFVGIKNYRDKYNGGVVSFGRALQIGLYIALIASTMYVATWLIEYYFFYPDFMEQYGARTLEHLRERGASEAEIAKKTKEFETMSGLYKNPVFVVLLTYTEILPLGIIVSLICAAILKRKPANPDPAPAA